MSNPVPNEIQPPPYRPLNDNSGSNAIPPSYELEEVVNRPEKAHTRITQTETPSEPGSAPIAPLPPYCTDYVDAQPHLHFQQPDVEAEPFPPIPPDNDNPVLNNLNFNNENNNNNNNNRPRNGVARHHGLRQRRHRKTRNCLILLTILLGTLWIVFSIALRAAAHDFCQNKPWGVKYFQAAPLVLMVLYIWGLSQFKPDPPVPRGKFCARSWLWSGIAICWTVWIVGVVVRKHVCRDN